MSRKIVEQLEELNRKMNYQESMKALLSLDQWQGLPAEGGTYRGEMGGYLDELQKELLVKEGKEVYDYYCKVTLEEIEDVEERAMARRICRGYHLATAVPEELQQEMNRVKVEATASWKEAREKESYEIFRPKLREVFQVKKKIATAIDPEREPLEVLAGMIDQGLDYQGVIRELDRLKAGLVHLLKQIKESTVRIDAQLMNASYSPEHMEALGRNLIQEFGYCPNRGGYSYVPHAFTSFLGPDDVRISTYKKGTVAMLYTYFHESGHGMYGQGASERVRSKGLYGGNYGSFHEGIARYYENLVGRNKGFCGYLQGRLGEFFPEWNQVSQEEIYRMLNRVQASPIRISADEVTYSLHPMIRFELERELLSDRLSFEDLPQAWNDKYEAYLGVHPENDNQGVLQDMHWAGDFIGYFQSYALGNIYDGQIYQALKQEYPQMEADLAKGRFDKLKEWMTRNIYQYSYTRLPEELLENLGQRSLDAGPYLAYLEEKYSEIYDLKEK